MQNEFRTKKLNNRGIFAGVVAILLIATTIYVAWKYFHRNYYVTSILVIAYTMIPFFAMFEKRSPKARELVTIAVMCAIAVASRAAFIWIDHFKPMAAIIIITGIALGAEAGFLTGALSVFVSNMIFGHGPWTPWQMFAFGILGFVAGICYRLKLLDKENKILLAIFGGIMILVLVGPLLDTASLFLVAAEITKNYVIATYISGLPVNVVHALATSAVLYFFSQPLFEKLDRLKNKYGMMEG